MEESRSQGWEPRPSMMNASFERSQVPLGGPAPAARPHEHGDQQPPLYGSYGAPAKPDMPEPTAPPPQFVQEACDEPIDDPKMDFEFTPVQYEKRQ